MYSEFVHLLQIVTGSSATLIYEFYLVLTLSFHNKQQTEHPSGSHSVEWCTNMEGTVTHLRDKIHYTGELSNVKMTEHLKNMFSFHF
jgi:hypothetical protein